MDLNEILMNLDQDTLILVLSETENAILREMVSVNTPLSAFIRSHRNELCRLKLRQLGINMNTLTLTDNEPCYVYQYRNHFTHPDTLLGLALHNNDTRLFYLSIDIGADPTFQHYFPMFMASLNGNIDILNRLLELGVDPSVNNDTAFRVASEHGHLNIVDRLLQVGVTPSNIALIQASRNGHFDIVERLLQFTHHIRPTFNRNAALRTASDNGHLEIVQRLLQSPSVLLDDPAFHNEAILLASLNGHRDIVQHLLNARQDINPSHALPRAIERGELDVVDLLLQDTRTNPSVDRNSAIILASRQGYIDVVRRLLQDPRVDPSDDNNAALYWARQRGYTDIEQLLLTDPRVENN